MEALTLGGETGRAGPGSTVTLQLKESDPVVFFLVSFQAQLVVLSAQIAWSENVENALSSIGGGGDVAPLQSVLSNVEVTLNVLADSVLMEQPPLRRRKLEHLVSLT